MIDRDLEKRKLNAEYKYLKAELEYQQALFDSAQGEFDDYFREKLDIKLTGKAAAKAIAEKTKPERREEVDTIYKKLAQKIHPDKKTGDEGDFKKLKEDVDNYDLDGLIDMAEKYEVDIEEEIDEISYLNVQIEMTKNKLDTMMKSLVLQWHNTPEENKPQLEQMILMQFGKS
tara:strand:+ start:72 stop:590 length:519 start_codon:yes stop_codon:yes gene_type:complete